MASIGEDIGSFFGNIGQKTAEAFTGRDVPTTRVTGVGNIGEDPEAVAAEYQRRIRQMYGGQQRAEERFTQGQQEQRILGAMAGTQAASQAARTQAMQGAQQTLGAASSVGGTAGIQTAALGALGAGQAQQYGLQEAAQIRAQEQQRNALAAAQMAELLRQQQMAQYGLERADYAQALGAQRATLAPELEIGQDYAKAEAQRQQRMFGAATGAAAAGVPYLIPAGTK